MGSNSPITVNGMLPMCTVRPSGSAFANRVSRVSLPSTHRFARRSTSSAVKKRPRARSYPLRDHVVLIGPVQLGEARLLLTVLEPQVLPRPLERRDRPDRRSVRQDRPRVLHGERAPLLEAVGDVAAEVHAGPDAADVDRVVAERLDALLDRALQAVDQRDHADDGRHADDDPEQREHRAQPVRDQRVGRPSGTSRRAAGGSWPHS